MAKELFLYGDIGESMFSAGITASAFIDQIKSAGNEPIDLRINSVGGDVFEGYAIYNALKRHKPGVTVYVDGLAASIASYIAMAGKDIYMADNAMLMIHLPYQGGGGGTADEMRKSADILDMITKSLVEAYSSRTGIPGEEITKMLDEETWLDSKQALAFGFVDGVTEPLEMAAKFDVKALSKFKNVPERLLRNTGTQEKTNMNQVETVTTTESPVTTIAAAAHQVGEKAGEAFVEAAAADPKPSIFSRVKAMLADKNEFLAQIESYKAQLEEKDKEIASLTNGFTIATRSLEAALKDVAQLQSDAKELDETITKLENDAKTASERAVDIVAAAGFPQEKLPAVQATGFKTAQDWVAEYEAQEPKNRIKFYRENKAAIDKANAELKAAEKQR